MADGDRTSLDPPQPTSARAGVTRVVDALASVVRGKREAIDRLLAGVLAGGHILMEDVPGVGKTTLAKTLARALTLDFNRVQCTPDLLPTDILGATILDPRDGSFSFRKGPVFTNLLLVDEINRASPRTQSALLEAMSEGQVSVDGTTHPLQTPFFVLATQNPVDYQGTYPLPEAQLDRFVMRIELGYPCEAEELEVLFARQRDEPLRHVQSVLGLSELVQLQTAVREVEVSRDVGRYILQLIQGTRHHRDLQLGASPRGALALFRLAQAWAYLQGRDWVSPGDVQRMAEPGLAHRILLSPQARYAGQSTADIVASVVSQVAIPT